MHAPSCLALSLLVPLTGTADGGDGRERGSAAPGFVSVDDMDWTGVLDEESFAALHELTEDEAPELRGDDVEVGDMAAYLSLPEHGEPLGGVVVIHEWWGLNDHVKHWADRLASDGYAALAVDLYEGTVATTRDEAMAAMRGVDEDAAMKRLRAAHAFLRDDTGPVDVERTACIGWCFGGGWSLRLATQEPELDAAILYYGRLITDTDVLANIECPVLGVFGNEDRGIPPEAVDAFADAMGTAGGDLELARYDANHAFANPSSARYDAEHASDAWRRSREFLCEHLWPEQDEGTFASKTRRMEAFAPEGWTAREPGGFRLIDMEIDDETECYVVALAGNGGGLGPNLNRWRQQMGQGELSDDELAALPLVPMFGRLAPMVRIEGASKPARGRQIDDAILLGAVCELEDEAVFVKLVGPRSSVESARTKFTAFCRGLR